MNMKQLVLCGLLAVSGGMALPIGAQAAVNVDIRIARPAPRIEVVPAPRRGYVWAPGYWRWRGHQHVWVAGHWIRERHGYHWVPGYWAR